MHMQPASYLSLQPQGRSVLPKSPHGNEVTQVQAMLLSMGDFGLLEASLG